MNIRLKQLLSVIPATQVVKIETLPENCIYIGEASGLDLFTESYEVLSVMAELSGTSCTKDGVIHQLYKMVLKITVKATD